MLDHVIVGVTDLKRSTTFFEAALEPLGYSVGFPGEREVGFNNAQGYPDFWIRLEDSVAPVHVAFKVETRALVDAFYAAAIAAGASDNGAPGLRPHYHEAYYAAFVLDADGHNIEAVCGEPES